MAKAKAGSPLIDALEAAGLEGADLIGEIKRSIVRPGDLIVLKTTVQARPEFEIYLRKQVRRLFPEAEVIVLGPDLELEIVAQVEAEGGSDV